MYAYLDSSGNVISASTVVREITNPKLVALNVTSRIDNAPSSLKTRGRAGESHHHKKVSGDGSDISHYSEIAQTVVVPASNNPMFFGASYYYAEDESETQTNSLSFVQKLKLEAVQLRAGDYRLSWYYKWDQTSAASSFQGQIQVDDSTIVHEHEERKSQSNISQKITVSGFKKITLTDGDHFIDLDFCSSAKQHTSKISQARIELWKV